VWDRSVPKEERAKLIIGGELQGLQLTEFGGKPVSWLAGKGTYMIPAGETSLIFRYAAEHQMGNQIRMERIENMRVENYTFIAGHTYRPLMHGQRVVIYDFTPGVSTNVLTISDLDEFNGEYVKFFLRMENAPLPLSSNGIKIENGVAVLPIGYSAAAFNENIAVSNPSIYIHNKQRFFPRLSGKYSGTEYSIGQIVFEGGTASVSFNDFTEVK